MSIVDTVLRRLIRFFRRALRRKEDERTRAVVATLKEIPVFRHLSRGALHDVAEAVHVRDYRRDEFIYYERDPGLGLYAIQQGRVRLVVELDDGGVEELRQVTDHEMFGWLSLLGDLRRMETAQAVTETRVIGLFRPDLKTILKRHPRTGAAVLEALARHVAAQHAELMSRLVGEEDKVKMMRLLHGLSATSDR